jgi:hypothetical protein
MRALITGVSLITLAAMGLSSTPARADATLKCTMTFEMKGWSAFYKTAAGSGTIHCSNGQSMHVKLSAKGGGLTVGKSDETGQGEFSEVTGIGEIFGSYVAAEAHAGAVKSAQVRVMTKGEVSLALSGKGRGWDLGVAFGELKIEKD